MELKRGDKVKYLGGKIAFGTKAGTDELEWVNMHPIDGVFNPKTKFTYIHHVIESAQDGNLYIIPHHKGVPKEFFTVNEGVFGKLDLSRLENQDRKGNLMKYIYVSADDLVLIPKVENPPNQQEINNKISQQHEGEDIPNLNKSSTTEEETNTEDITFKLNKEEIEDEDIPSTDVEDDDSTEHIGVFSQGDFEDGSEKVAEEIVDDSTEFISSNNDTPESEDIVVKPHYTYHNYPKDGVTSVVPKQNIIRGVKINEEFTVETANGEIEEGKSGDVLMITKEDKLFIEKKEDITDKYDHIDDVQKITLEGDEKEYILPLAVYNRFNELKGYITELENLNIETRDKLYLKYPQEK